MARVKICGLTNEADLKLCLAAGVDTVGFVVNYPEAVPWNISLSQAAKLITQVPPYVSSCIVTGGSSQKILALAKELKPNMIQLHHRESLAEVKELSQALSSMGIKTIKALPINERGQCNFQIADPILATQALNEAGVWAILVDSYTSKLPGGTGKLTNLAIFETIKIHSSVPVILAGGLNPENVREILLKVRPFAVDVLSGVEQFPGKKDPLKVRKFMQAVLTAKIKEIENYPEL